MPRYLVERTFPGGLQISANEDGAAACARVVDLNADEGVTWVHSYVSEDNKKMYDIYDSPTPESIRKAAARTGFPIDKIERVTVLDPYFHR